MIALGKLLQLKRLDQRVEFDDTYTMLYGLSIGFASDPLNRRELGFVYEKDLRSVPTMACALTVPSSRLLKEEAGIDFSMVVAGEKWIEVHKPMPVAGKLSFDTRVVGAWDKGSGKGAVILTETELRDRASGDRLCTMKNTTFARGDGGFGGPRDGAPGTHALPRRDPDEFFEAPTTPSQGLLYRLLGDRNPIHADPDAATRAGFRAPILHGLCTLGNCCRAILSTFCDYEPSRICQMGLRLSAPVFPGETLSIEMWNSGSVVSFRAKVQERLVVDNGHCTLRS